MEDVHPIATAGSGLAESPTFDQQAVLERAITKLILLGKQVGVSADQMISLLESGWSVVDLVDYMAARRGQSRCD